MDKIWLVLREDLYEEECSCGNYLKVPENSYLSSWSTKELANTEMKRLRDSGMKSVYVYSVHFNG
jgi:hypothetical protein